MTFYESQLLDVRCFSKHVLKIGVVCTQVVKETRCSTENTGDVQVACNCQILNRNSGRTNSNYRQQIAQIGGVGGNT